MNTKLLAAGLAAIFLSACSETKAPGPFDGKSPEEVVLFILSGIERDKTVEVPRQGTVKTVTVSEKPLIVDLKISAEDEAQLTIALSVEDKGNCKFAFKAEGGRPKQTPEGFSSVADLSNLVSGKQSDLEKVVFEGAKLQCVDSTRSPCKAEQENFDKGQWPRFGPSFYHHRGDQTAVENANKRLSDAITHLKTKICKA